MAEVRRLVTVGNRDPHGPPVHDNNVWLVGDDAEVIVIDPSHDPAAVAAAVGERRVAAIVCTHGHWDHVRAARDFAALVGDVPVRLGPGDAFLWREFHGEAPFVPLVDGERLAVADVALIALATPGHTPGSTCLHAPDLGVVFSGDTLFEGGPGATRWDYSSFDSIIDSISSRLLVLPDDTVVHPGHGASTSIGAERPHLTEWVARGW